MTKRFTIAVLLLSAVSLGARVASAHAVVSPHQAGIGSFNTFTLAVPSEKPQAVVGVRLLMPTGLSEVTPDVKQGWHVSVRKGADDDVTEIDWSGGVIPQDLRDEFSFSAQVPATTTVLAWKAYQTYADGSVVSWDQTPVAGGGDDSVGGAGPYSTTNVVDDLASPTAPASPTADWALGISIFALLMAAFASSQGRLAS